MGAPLPTQVPLREALPYLWRPPAVEGGWQILGAPDRGRRIHGSVANDFLQHPFIFRGVLSAEQCERMARLGDAAVLWNGESTGGPGYRRCVTSFLEEQEETRDVFDALRAIADSANDRYGFALSGFGEPLHLIRYDAGDGFGWHTDLGNGPASTRKLSISVQLSKPSEYHGGTLELCPHGVASEFREQGDAFVFPAYIPHRISSVERGTRRALVAWIHGDAYA